MNREAVTLSVLLTIGVTLLGIGVDLLQQGEYVTGAVCVAVGFGVICIGVYLFQKGIIEEITEQIVYEGEEK